MVSTLCIRHYDNLSNNYVIYIYGTIILSQTDWLSAVSKMPTCGMQHVMQTFLNL